MDIVNKKGRLSQQKDPLQIFSFIFLTIFGLLILIPFINVVVISFTSQAEYLSSKLLLFPTQPNQEPGSSSTPPPSPSATGPPR